MSCLPAVLPGLIRPAGLACLLAAATVALFAPAFSHDFINYDDGLYVYENSYVAGGLSWPGLAYAFHTIDGGSWMPLTWISLMLDVTVYGLQPAGFHLTNVLWHTLSAALLFLALQRMTRSLWRSTFVAAAFAFHPLRAESVVWIAERKDVLSAFFFMAGLWAYARYAEFPSPKRLAPVFACLLGGLLAKPMVVTFPFVLLLLDFWPLGRAGNSWAEARPRLWPLVREKIPLLLPCIGVALVTVWTQYREGAILFLPAALPMQALGVADNYAFYLQKVFRPDGLSVLYPLNPLVGWEAILGALLLAVATGWAVCRMFRRPWFFTGWLWFVIMLAPVSGLFRLGHILVADRYTYLPSVGLMILAAWGAAAWLEQRRWDRRWLAVAGMAVLTILAATTAADLPRWKNSFALYEAALRVGPHHVAYNNRGVAWLQAGDAAAALADFDAALRLQPDYAEAHENRGNAWNDLRRHADALLDFNEAIRLDPLRASAYNGRGMALVRSGDRQGAMADFNTAIRLSPDYAPAYNNRGSLWNDLGNYAAAVQDCTTALGLNPGLADACNNRGNAWSRQNEPARAVADYDRAIRINPRNATYYNNRAAALYDLGEFERARADLEHCRRLGGTPHPGLVEALARVLGSRP